MINSISYLDLHSVNRSSGTNVNFVVDRNVYVSEASEMQVKQVNFINDIDPVPLTLFVTSKALCPNGSNINSSTGIQNIIAILTIPSTDPELNVSSYQFFRREFINPLSLTSIDLQLRNIDGSLAATTSEWDIIIEFTSEDKCCI